MKDILLHEIAHALVGEGIGHSSIFKSKARSIGCINVNYGTVRLKSPIGKYKYKCPNCDYIQYYYRKRRVESACKECCRKYNHGRFSKKFVLREVKNNK